ncbi:MAG TPA: trypsin-like peptidase domain-containing protein [Ignavibacteriaceae bacterium]|nr:trypsin-like peptidase domain-containing protein [Ignavibacteriaceae bacterium]
MKMSNKSKIITFILAFLVLSGSIFYIVKSDAKPLYQETDIDTLKTNVNNAISSSRNNIITETVKKVSPAVVGINVTEIVKYRDPFGSLMDDPFFRQFFGDRGNYNQKVMGLGSGYLISADGYIVTNDHVAGNAAEITVTMTNGKHYNAKVVGTDPTSDICLLKIDANNLPYMTLGNSDNVIIGEWVIALGNPFGLFALNDQPTVTVGVVSAKGMNLEPINKRYYLNMIQTDAAINGGNSGGPLVNAFGEIIGMNTLIYTAGGVQGNIGLGFAIPINKVKNIIQELKDKGKIDRDFDIGLRVQTIDDEIAKYYKLETTRGVIITQVLPNTPAARSDLKVGDIIEQIEDYKVSNVQTIEGIFQEFRAGQKINIKVLRDNEEKNISMKLEKR